MTANPDALSGDPAEGWSAAQPTSGERAHSYAEGLARYVAAVRSAGVEMTASDARMEHHYEGLRDWSLFHSLVDVEEWFQQQRRHCTMRVTEIPLNEVEGWEVDPVTGNVRHCNGEFFTIHGIRVEQTFTREVGAVGWSQPILAQVGYDGGLLGLLRQRFEGVPHYLIEAKAEPGNPDLLQLSPTLQATFSNLRRAHRGRKPAFAELFEYPERAGATVLYGAWLSEDGGRLYLKRNRGMLVELPEGTALELPASFIWMSMFQIKACLKRDAWVNPHVRGIIAHL